MFRKPILWTQQQYDRDAEPAGPDSFVVVDIETSGLYPESHKIIEIAAIKVINGCVQQRMLNTLVQYKGNLPKEIQQLTNINPSDLRNAPDRRVVFEAFRDFVGDLPMVGHNIKDFDSKFLWFNFLYVGLEPMTNELIDTLQIAKSTINVSRYRLGDLARYFRISAEGAHRALDDAKVTLKLYSRLRKMTSNVMSEECNYYHLWNSFGATETNPKYLQRASHNDHPNIVGKYFCVTTFESFGSFYSQVDLHQFIVDSGGFAQSNVTLKTNYLIDCTPNLQTSKERKAIEYNSKGKADIKIISPKEFLKLIK